jgi:hypothetical protein
MVELTTMNLYTTSTVEKNVKRWIHLRNHHIGGYVVKEYVHHVLQVMFASLPMLLCYLLNAQQVHLKENQGMVFAMHVNVRAVNILAVVMIPRLIVTT